MDQVEGEVAGDRGQVDELGEDQGQQDQQAPGRLALGQGRVGLALGAGLQAGQAVMFVPDPDVPQDGDRDQGQKGENPQARLAVADHEDGRRQGPDRRAEVAADLEHRLGEARPLARRHAGDARGLRVEHRRADAEDAGADQDHAIAVGDRQDRQADQREQGAARQGHGRGPLVGVPADQRLQDRGGDLVAQGHQADLAEGQAEVGLELRVDGRQQRLHHVVEAVAHRDGGDDPEHGVAGGLGRRFRGHGRGFSDLQFVGHQRLLDLTPHLDRLPAARIPVWVVRFREWDVV